jgi:hypothetical protein
VLGKDACDWDEHIPSSRIPWMNLTPKVIWRGSNFNFIDLYQTMPGNGSSVMSLPLNKNTTKEEAISMLVQFWNLLTPRWKAVVMTLQAELQYTDPWIDVKFASNGDDVLKYFQQHGVPVCTKHMDYEPMSQYKYQIDLGGGGGTSWRGTLSKLGMP